MQLLRLPHKAREVLTGATKPPPVQANCFINIAYFGCAWGSGSMHDCFGWFQTPRYIILVGILGILNIFALIKS